MAELGKRLAALALLLLPLALPFWYQAVWGRADPTPLSKARGASCLEPAASMRAHHAELLRRYREAVVRGETRRATLAEGSEGERSLSGACLRCHPDARGFCERCHERLGTSISCFGCHDAAGGG